MKRIVLITSGQPSLNPRLVKEADALGNNGYQVTVLYLYWNKWGSDLDYDLLKYKKWKFIRVGGTPKTNKLTYWCSRIIFKIFTFFAKQFTFEHQIAENAMGRCSNHLLKNAKKFNADLYIAHNLAALPVAVMAAKKNKAKCGFDAEDFHRYESSNNSCDFKVKLNTFIEDKYLKQVDYLTTASPLIAKSYQSLYPNVNPIVINNVFELKHQPELSLNQTERLKLFWFSQTIGKNRGLEDVIEALNIINDKRLEL
ncbi:MAG: hypothetical protein EOO96_17950, partial [Pedobacter sp.]